MKRQISLPRHWRASLGGAFAKGAPTYASFTSAEYCFC
ncbi:hypothetical protein BIWAKO_02852 [Bosea sp. BIWAKO-01]|nr:hypothetical protein BIWAKO_02852 [Bosea sp. BIWAKO-01]